MFEVNAECDFAAGHALRGYFGKCENKHGHNYKVHATVAGESLDEIGSLIDFKVLCSAMNRVLDQLDHQYLNNIPPFTEVNPSAENIANYIFHQIQVQLKETGKGKAQLLKVKAWETDRNSATYFE